MTVIYILSPGSVHCIILEVAQGQTALPSPIVVSKTESRKENIENPNSKTENRKHGEIPIAIHCVCFADSKLGFKLAGCPIAHYTMLPGASRGKSNVYPSQ